MSDSSGVSADPSTLAAAFQYYTYAVDNVSDSSYVVDVPVRYGDRPVAYLVSTSLARC